MLQVATFLVPAEQGEANEFLRTHKPEGQINFTRDAIVIFCDNGETTPELEIAGLQEPPIGNRNAKFQQQVAVEVTNAERGQSNEHGPLR